MRDTIPEDAHSFLSELYQLPAKSIRIEYDIEGPGVMKGRLTLSLKEGGYRREQWSVQGEQGVIEGETIQRPEGVWSRATGEKMTVSPGEAGVLAEAYLKLDEGARRQVLQTIRSWYRSLEAAKDAKPGSRDSILGVSCLRQRVAAQSVCLWEESGLPLRYEGAVFKLEAKKIERDPDFGPGFFDRPDAKSGSPEGAAADGTKEGVSRATELMAALVAGDQTVMAILLSFRFGNES